MRQFGLIIMVFLIGVTSCTVDPTIIEDNDAPYYAGVPRVLIENYINRLYIDLIGREPLDVEMDADVLFLRGDSLSMEVREALVERLQFDSSFVEGDISYRHAFHQRLYDLNKVRLLEGTADADVQQQINIYRSGAYRDSLNGNMTGYFNKHERADKLADILSCKDQLRKDEIGLREVYKRMVHNEIYDVINMNTFNFINATFDDCFFRFPSQNEFNTAFNIIEYNTTDVIFGGSAQNKQEYVELLIGSREFSQGLIIWAYTTLMAREPSTAEINELLADLHESGNFYAVQKAILITDEYANF